MSRHFAGSSWKASHFAGSHFRAPAPLVVIPSAGGHWANSHFKARHFATTHFRGEPVAVETAGHHWKNSQFKCRQFSTRHFRGVSAPLGPPKRRRRRAWWANWGWPETKSPVPALAPTRVAPEDDEAMAFALLEAEELL